MPSGPKVKVPCPWQPGPSLQGELFFKHFENFQSIDRLEIFMGREVPPGRSWLALSLRLGALPFRLGNGHLYLPALCSARCQATVLFLLRLPPPNCHPDLIPQSPGPPRRQGALWCSARASRALRGAISPPRAMGSEAAQLLEAADFAARKHRGQRRKDPEGTPYINHPIGRHGARGATAMVSGGGACPSASTYSAPSFVPVMSGV